MSSRFLRLAEPDPPAGDSRAFPEALRRVGQERDHREVPEILHSPARRTTPS